MTEVELLTQISNQLAVLISNLDKYALVMILGIGISLLGFLWPRR